MRNRIFVNILLVVITGLSYAASGEEILVIEPDAQLLRESVITWTNNITSFMGAYTIYVESLDLDHPEIPDPPRDRTVEYRFDGENRYIDFFRSESGIRNQIAYSNGVLVTLDTYPPLPNGDIEQVAETIPGPWKSPWPENMTMPPSRVFQYQLGTGTSLEEFLSMGHSLVRDRQGEQVLIHRHPTSGRVEIFFDDKGHVKCIQHNNDWPYLSESEKQFAGDPLELHDPFSASHYRKYTVINNIPFPLSYSCIQYRMDPHSPSAEIWEARNAGQVGLIMAELIVAQRGEFYENYKVFIEYDKETLIINTPLDLALFTIEIPKTAGIRMPDMTVEKQTDKGRLNIPFLSVACVLVLSAVLIGALLYYLKALR